MLLLRPLSLQRDARTVGKLKTEPYQESAQPYETIDPAV